MESPTIEQLRRQLAAAQAENRPEDEARLMRMIEARMSSDPPPAIDVAASTHGARAGQRKS
jgi:hypothetical protein